MEHIFGDDFKLENTCVTFGKFDGLHRGHRAVIEQTVSMRDAGLTPVLLSYDYTPFSLFSEESVIYTETEKAVLLESSGLGLLISWPMTAEIIKLEPEAFVKEILIDKLGAKAVVTGESCRFGAGMRGDAALLKKLAEKYGFKLIICDTEKDAGCTITSSMIRREISACSLDEAGKLLGHPFSIFGSIVHGKALGRTAKLPTANIDYGKNKLIPPHGVYATLARLDGEALRGLSIIGLRPTVDNLPDVTVETYLLDFSGDIYGRNMLLDVHVKVREIRKFKDLHEVKIQVEKDIESVRDYLDNMI